MLEQSKNYSQIQGKSPANPNEVPIPEKDFQKIRDLIKINEAGDIHNNVSDKIVEGIEKIFKQASTVPASQYPELIKLLTEVIKMDRKGMAADFYDLLSENKFPFSTELLRYALDHEMEYNRNYVVFKNYLYSASRGTEAERILDPFCKILFTGKAYNFEILNKMRGEIEKKNPEGINVPENIQTTVIHSIKEEARFSMTTELALETSVYLNLKAAIPKIREHIEVQIMKLNSFDVSTLDQTPSVPSDEELIKNNWRAPAAKVRDICVTIEQCAAALYYLTNDNRYKILREATKATAGSNEYGLSEMSEHSWYSADDREFFKKVVQDLKEATKDLP